MKDLIVRVEGKVLSNNFTEFEAAALEVLDSMSTELVTDDDFIKAAKDITLCKEVEDRLDNVKQDIIDQSKDVSEAVTCISDLFTKFRDKRLKQNELIREWKTERRNKIVSEAAEDIRAVIADSPVAHGYSVSLSRIEAVVKGKQTRETMEKATKQLIDTVSDELTDLEEHYKQATEEIEITEKQYPGLFPDKKTLALKSFDTVTATIEARVNKFKLDQAEKIKREAEAEKVRREAHEHNRKVVEEQAKKEEMAAQDDNKRPDAILQEPVKQESYEESKRNYQITLEIFGTKEDAVEVAQKINDDIAEYYACIKSVQLNKVAA